MNAAAVLLVLGLVLSTNSVISLAQEDAVVKAKPAQRVYSRHSCLTDTYLLLGSL